jgi:UDP-glucose 4-epimerase
MSIAWVIGAGGVLGSALCRALQRDERGLFQPQERFSWSDPALLGEQLALAVREFSRLAARTGRWEIYWAAGIGTMGSLPGKLDTETRALRELLQFIAREPALTAAPGALAYASSAGAIYAGSPDYVITEQSEPAPTTEYARVKLLQEDMIREFAGTRACTRVLIARLSTLYGPGQSRGKPQGLLSHIARSILKNIPVQIYVPLDTIRDYISADDAAAAMVARMGYAGDEQPMRTAIIASGIPVTIAEIIATFKKVTRRMPRIVTGTNTLGANYPRRVFFKSAAQQNDAGLGKTSLLVGISAIMAAERIAHMRGWRAQGE